MEYPFESLDPERFQHFCQALIAREFKEVQCFPVGQPDGGRDALSYYTERTGREFIMYQIKFVRNPLAEKDPHQWLTKILEDEAPKFKKQMPRGAQKYILITNVAGTAHPDVGSIDKTNKILNDQLGVPSMCWWRDDLSRRLDNAWDLKWIYSELMTGPDLIRAVMEQGLSEKREKRASAIRAFVKDQFDKDQDVRFKQVDLQNKLIDLFIDVPIAFPQSIPTRRGKFNKHHEFRRIIHQLISISSVNTEIDFSVEDYSSASIDVTREYLLGRDEQIVIGSASLILHPLAQKNIPRMVLEGAPGQGKSTITQYISQVHRMKVLKKMS